MSSNFLLELDTTGPDFTIEAPSISPKDTVIEMYLRADEPLLMHEILFYNGSDEYRLTFSLIEPNLYFGFINLEQYLEGSAKFIITLWDTVMNKTTKEFLLYIGNIAKNLVPKIEISETRANSNILGRTLIMEITSRSTECDLIARNLQSTILDRDMTIVPMARTKYIEIGGIT